MGIKDINKTLKEKVPEAFKLLPLKSFSKKVIAIDTSLWLFKIKSSALKDILGSSRVNVLEPIDESLIIQSIINNFNGFNFKLTENNITPVWIFDGETHPAKAAVLKRKSAKEKIKLNIEEERARITSLPIEKQLEELPKFKKALLNCVNYTKRELDALREEINDSGTVILDAPYDGEIYASKLSKKGLIAAVYTCDTDTYPAGAAITITGFSKVSSTEGVLVDCFINKIALEKLNLTPFQFTDFCIMHGCDFNERIKRVGPKTILSKMEKYDFDLSKWMEAEPDLNWECLNLDVCREIFNSNDLSSITISDLSISREKWITKTLTKRFEMFFPDSPEMIEI